MQRKFDVYQATAESMSATEIATCSMRSKLPGVPWIVMGRSSWRVISS